MYKLFNLVFIQSIQFFCLSGFSSRVYCFTTFITPLLSLTTRFATAGTMHLLYYSFVLFLASAFLLRSTTFSFSRSHGSAHHTSPHHTASQQYSHLNRTTYGSPLHPLCITSRSSLPELERYSWPTFNKLCVSSSYASIVVGVIHKLDRLRVLLTTPSTCRAEISQFQSLGQSHGGKYPYFRSYPNFLTT